jgi:hypothetical protein
VVLEEPIGDDRWLAVCGHDEEGCLDEELEGRDLELLAAAGQGLAAWLRTALGATGTALRLPRHPGVHGLGRIRRGDEDRDAILVTGATASQLEQFVGDLSRTGSRWLVLLPNWGAVHGELRLHAGGGLVHLAALETMFHLEAGQLTMRTDALYPTTPAPLPLLVSEPPLTPPAAPAVCVVHDHDGRRELTVAGYQALVARAGDFDLFIDTTVTAERGGHRALRRDLQARSEETSLTRHEAAVLVELITTRRAMRSGDFPSVEVNALAKVIERARRKVDVSLGRYAWRAIHTIASGLPEAKRWQFNPPEALCFALIVPRVS